MVLSANEIKEPAVNFERGPRIQRTTVCSYISGKILVLKEMTRQHEAQEKQR